MVDKPGLMNGHSVAKTVADCVMYCARAAGSPVFKDIKFDQQTGTFTVSVNLPGPQETYRITAERV